MKEKIDKFINKVRLDFSSIHKTLKEMEDTFVFKDFERFKNKQIIHLIC